MKFSKANCGAEQAIPVALLFLSTKPPLGHKVCGIQQCVVGDGSANKVVRSGGSGFELPDDFIRVFFSLRILEFFDLLIVTFFNQSILGGCGGGDRD
jgi:hypothetical protein